jgi:hypothetical protein
MEDDIKTLIFYVLLYRFANQFEKHIVYTVLVSKPEGKRPLRRLGKDGRIVLK